MKTLFERFLLQAGILHTRRYARKVFLTCPLRNTLWGMSRLLRLYGVRPLAMRIANKKRLGELPVPFIAELAGEAVIVERVADGQVAYSRHSGEDTVAADVFAEQWTGVVLLAETGTKTGEPDYEKHRSEERRLRLENFAAILCGMFVVVVCLSCAHSYSIVALLSVLLNGIALSVCYLLMQKVLHKENKITDRICGFLRQGSCDDVLNTKAAKLGGVYSWSECGFSFFSCNILLVLLFPKVADTGLPLVFLCALPFTLWSVWYQGYKVKKWCPLCLLIQFIVWLQFFIYCLFGCYELPVLQTSLYYWGIWMIPASYMLLTIVVHRLVLLFGYADRVMSLQQGLNRMKSDKVVFQSLLHAAPRHDTDARTSSLLFGCGYNGRPRITVMSNPYCAPCARMHKRLQTLFDNGFEIQYVFTAFSEELKGANHYFIACYRKYGADRTWEELSRWYEGGQQQGRSFFDGVVTREESMEQAVKDEIKKHDDWIAHSGFAGTPTLLVDGYPLPVNYEIEDIMEFY